MSSKQHYVSRFHLAWFTDASVGAEEDPWLWIGDRSDGSVRRRAPKNVGWARQLYPSQKVALIVGLRRPSRNRGASGGWRKPNSVVRGQGCDPATGST